LITVFQTRGELNAAKQVLKEEWFAVTRFGMAQGGVPDSAAFKVLPPDNGMILPHRAALVGRLVQKTREHAHFRARARFKVIPFIGAYPFAGQMARRGMTLIFNVNRRLRDRRVVVKFGAEQFRVPWPGPFRPQGPCLHAANSETRPVVPHSGRRRTCSEKR
jgi:hypothetical protein